MYTIFISLVPTNTVMNVLTHAALSSMHSDYGQMKGKTTYLQIEGFSGPLWAKIQPLP